MLAIMWMLYKSVTPFEPVRGVWYIEGRFRMQSGNICLHKIASGSQYPPWPWRPLMSRRSNPIESAPIAPDRSSKCHTRENNIIRSSKVRGGIEQGVNIPAIWTAHAWLAPSLPHQSNMLLSENITSIGFPTDGLSWILQKQVRTCACRTIRTPLTAQKVMSTKDNHTPFLTTFFRI
jgi:hypothetical protein